MNCLKNLLYYEKYFNPSQNVKGGGGSYPSSETTFFNIMGDGASALVSPLHYPMWKQQ